MTDKSKHFLKNLIIVFCLSDNTNHFYVFPPNILSFLKMKPFLKVETMQTRPDSSGIAALVGWLNLTTFGKLSNCSAAAIRTDSRKPLCDEK